MTVPVAVRAVLAAVGAMFVLSTWGSMIGPLTVPRTTSDRRSVVRLHQVKEIGGQSLFIQAVGAARLIAGNGDATVL